MSYIYKFLTSELTLNSSNPNTVSNGTLIRLVNIVNQHHHVTQTYANGATKLVFTLIMDSELIIEKEPTDGLKVDSGSDVLASWIAYRN